MDAQERELLHRIHVEVSNLSGRFDGFENTLKSFGHRQDRAEDEAEDTKKTVYRGVGLAVGLASILTIISPWVHAFLSK